MNGRSVTITWEGRKVSAFVPRKLRGPRITLSATTARATERAAGAVGRLGDRQAAGLEVAARFLLRSEGLASSFIEGVEADVADVALAAVDENVGGPAGWVADNLVAINMALRSDRPLSVGDILSWHRSLMRHAPTGQAFVGRWRDRQGWVGGANPLVAAYVPPPASKIDDLMADLVRYAALDDHDSITQAAVVHAQFETIHPFADGNGRIGRILIAHTLRRRLGVRVPPPVSIAFARDIGGYLSGLTLYRQGAIEPWVSWFANAVERSASASSRVLDAITELRDDWRRRTQDLRSDAAARKLVEHLVEQPVVSAQHVARLLSVSEQAARGALSVLAERGVLSTLSSASTQRATTAGRPPVWWAAVDLLDLLGR